MRANFRRLAKKHKSGDVEVGYTASYAVQVHEAERGKKNPPRTDAQRKAMFAKMRENEERGHVPWAAGQPKFLEQPFREMSGELVSITGKAIRAGAPLQKALLVAGLRLQGASQKLVPVDLGNLKGSAFTRMA